MTIKLRILIAFAISLFLALVINAFITVNISASNMRAALSDSVQDKLTASRELVKSKVEGYFGTIERQITASAANVATMDAAIAFSRAFETYSFDREYSAQNAWPKVQGYYQNDFANEYRNHNADRVNTASMTAGLDDVTVLLQYDFVANNPSALGSKDELYDLNNGTDYATAHSTYHNSFRTFLQTFGFYDIFIVEPENGFIVYSVYKELDFATSLINGPYADTGIGQAFKQGMTLAAGETHLTDFDSYLPSYNNAASFMSTPIFRDGELLGILIFQMPIDALNNAMTQDQNWKANGFGDSGEVYLVGTDNTLRNESRFFVEDKTAYLNTLTQNNIAEVGEIKVRNTSIALQKVNTPGAAAALKGQLGFDIFEDYRGVPVLSAYTPVKVGGYTWALMSEIDEAEAFAPAEDLVTSIIGSSAAVTAVILLICFAVVVPLTNYLINPIKQLASQFNELNSEDANLTKRVPASGILEIDEVSNGFNTFISQIQQIINAVKTSSQQISSASNQLSANTKNTSDSAKNQRNEAETVTEAIFQFNQALTEVSENSVQASNNTQLCKESANDNAERAAVASENIAKLVEEVTHSAKSLENLRDEVANINEVLNVINGIADQTNLLALNAAIEAARAGEQGRGFAVVAEEVRNLASRTQQSTVEIQDKTSQLTKVANEAVDSMQRASNSADKGIEQVSLVNRTLRELSGRVDDLALINKTVASATEQQRVTCESINQNIEKVKDASQSLTADSHQIDLAAADLSNIAEGMQQQVERFRA